MELIKRVLQGVALSFAVILLVIIGAGGMLLDLLGAAASALIGVAMIAAGCAWMEADDDE